MSWPLFATAIGVVLIGAGIWLAFGSDGDSCERQLDHPEWSVARHWNEATLNAIRRDIPAPTVHARNLFHGSAAMWDAWAAFDDSATGYFVNEAQSASDINAAREEAMSYAAYRILDARYIDSIGAIETVTEIDQLMVSLCYSIGATETEGDSPAALGNRIAATILEIALDDGSNEARGYEDPTYEPVNEPLVVAEPGADLAFPNRWQPLELQEMISQNGILVQNASQEFIDPHWGYVTGFALADPGPDGMPIDPGPPPLLGDSETDAAFKEAVVEVIRYSSLLDPARASTIDISPGTLGNSLVGTNDGTGFTRNPVTGEPYAPNLVSEADFGRVVAEFWADGPESETPPGHWNTLANAVSDQLDQLRIGGTTDVQNRLEWDTKLYLALNGAVHDAAIAAWGTKGHYDYVRPISMIRFMGGLGQSSDADASRYDQRGLPLVEGLIEVITAETTAAGGTHELLAGHEGEIAVLAWSGTPDDQEMDVGGVRWIRAVEWVPYQQPSFVTPSFAAYVSGHSTFSRAAAEVLAGFTGSPYFPNGLGEWTIAAGSLEFEAGPVDDVTLQWASYADAADQAGLSRLYGGIHVRADDLAGRIMGEAIGQAAWQHVQQYYGG